MIRKLLCLMILSVPYLSISSKPLTIPAIKQWSYKLGEYNFSEQTRILVDENNVEQLSQEAQTFAQDLNDLKGIETEMINNNNPLDSDIFLTIDPNLTYLGDEGYTLDISDHIKISSSTSKGVFYGTRTILQLLKNSNRIRAGNAIDYPSMPERALMVDNGRKFFTRDWLETHIKELSYLKMNIFHWHFSENLGFRIESKRYPEIVSEDHLSQEDVKYLLEVARKYHVEIIPEIDMPGHMEALLKGRTDELGLMYENGFIIESFLDITKDTARKFVADVIDEFIDLFPGRYWHMGTDEYIYGNFEDFPQFEKYAVNKYGEGALPSDAIFDFINFVNEIVKAKGKRLRIWNDSYSRLMSDLNKVKLDTNIVIEYWVGDDQPQAIIDSGFCINNCSIDFLYYIIGTSYIGYYDYLYGIWHPGLYQANKPVDTTSGKNLGAKYHIWCDFPNRETQWHIAKGISKSLRILAQNLWVSEKIVPTMAQFETIIDTIGNAPLTNFPDNPMPGNLLFGKEMISSGDHPAQNNLAKNLNDAYYHSKWSSDISDSAWVYVDLKDTFNIEKVKIVWYRQVPEFFTLQFSIDNIHWKEIDKYSPGFRSIYQLDSISKIARYIRVNCFNPIDSNYFAIYEMEAYGEEYIAEDTSKESNFANSKIIVLPNPAQNTFELIINYFEANEVEISISDLNGNTIQELGKYFLNSTEFRLNVNSQFLRNGIYFVSMKFNNGKIESKKLIISR